VRSTTALAAGAANAMPIMETSPDIKLMPTTSASAHATVPGNRRELRRPGTDGRSCSQSSRRNESVMPFRQSPTISGDPLGAGYFQIFRELVRNGCHCPASSWLIRSGGWQRALRGGAGAGFWGVALSPIAFDSHRCCATQLRVIRRAWCTAPPFPSGLRMVRII